MKVFIKLAVCPKRVCISTVGVRSDLFARDPHKVAITDFFGALRPVDIVATDGSINLTIPSEFEIVKSPDPQKKQFAYASQFPTIPKATVEL